MTKQSIKLALLAMALLVSAVPFANASAQLSLTDGIIAPIVILDNQPGDINLNVGVITYSGPIGSIWNLTVTTGITKPFSGDAIHPSLDLNSVSSSTGAGTLTIMFSDDFFGPLPAGYYFQGSIGGTTVGTITFQTYLDTTNAIFGLNTPLTSQTFANPPIAFSGTSFSGPVTPPTPYSLTQIAIITHTGQGGLTSFNGSTTAVPEPSALLLLGSGLSAIGFWRLRKRS